MVAGIVTLAVSIAHSPQQSYWCIVVEAFASLLSIECGACISLADNAIAMVLAAAGTVELWEHIWLGF